MPAPLSRLGERHGHTRSCFLTLHRLIVWAFFCISFAGKAKAQAGAGGLRVDPVAGTVSVRTWGVEQGLPQGSVNELALDGEGYVWGATYGGLFRFDGQLITRYSVHDLPILVSNAVSAILADDEGNIWLGTPRGTVARTRSGKLLDTLRSPSTPLLFGIDALAMDGSGTIWMRAQKAVYAYSDGRWLERPLPHPSYSMLARDHEGALVYSGPDGLVRILNGRDSVLAPAFSASVEEQSHGILVDGHGRIWVGQPDGLLVWWQGAMHRVPGISAEVRALAAGDQGSIWVGAGREVYRLRSSENHLIESAPELILRSNANVLSLLFTEDRVLLGGTEAGLFSVRERAVELIPGPAGPSHREVSSVLQADADGVWVTGICTGAYLLSPNGRVIDSIAQPVGGACVRSLAAGAEHSLWYGSDGELLRRDSLGKSLRWRLPAWNGTPNLARPLLVSADSLIFGLSDGRLGVLRANDSLRVPAPWDRVTGIPVESLAADDDGSIWVGQLGRVSRWQGPRVDAIDEASGFPSAVPRAMLAEPGMGVWVGTYGSGLWFISTESRARNVPTVDETISAILDDGQGHLWMPGNRGISIIDHAELMEWIRDSTLLPAVRLLSDADGVPEGNVGYPAASLLDRGRLGFASVIGLVVVDGAGMSDESVRPSVRVDELRTPARRIIPGNAVVTLGTNERSFAMRYSSPSFRYGNEVQFRYRVSAHDSTWLPLGTARETYVSLPGPGHYLLSLEARVPGSGWVAAGAVSLEALAFWHERTSIRLLLLAVLLGLMFMIFRQRVQAARLQTVAATRLHEVEYKAQQDASVREARHLQELAQVGRLAVAGELAASLSHELGQPLAAIVNNAEAVRRLVGRRTAGKEASLDSLRGLDAVLGDVVAQGRRASGIIREYRRFLGRNDVERELVDVAELIESAASLIRREFDSRDISLELRLEGQLPLISCERVLLQQVLVNLLQNAIEAADRERVTASLAVPDAELTNPPPRRVLLRARVINHGRDLRISVSDSGPGVPLGMRRRVFEPFMTTRRTGMGLGLAISRRVVEAHHGYIAMGGCVGGGAVVSFVLPVHSEVAGQSAIAIDASRVDVGVGDKESMVVKPWPGDRPGT